MILFDSCQAVKEDGGDRGWVPVSTSVKVLSQVHTSQSWFIGKHSNSANGSSVGVPATPAGGAPSSLAAPLLDTELRYASADSPVIVQAFGPIH